MGNCGMANGITEDTPEPTTTEEICSMSKKSFSCYPKCMCDDPTLKEDFDMMVSILAAMDCKDVKCGAAGLRASVLTSILAALSVAIFAAK